jgi:hypothetical protein
VAISPHHYYHWDHTWKIQGPLEIFQHKVGIFDRNGPYSLDGFRGSGSDFLPEFKKHIEDGKRSFAHLTSCMVRKPTICRSNFASSA